jgi:hypothetical protein
MNIMAWLMAWIIWANGLLALGWTYDLSTGRFVPPAQPAQQTQTINATAPRR